MKGLCKRRVWAASMSPAKGRNGAHVRIEHVLSLLRHPVVRIATGVLVLVGLLALTVGPAFAHSNLVSSSPADGATLEQAPSEVKLTFSASVLGDFTEVVVRSGDGGKLTTDKPVTSGNIVTQALPAGLPKGSYVVVFRVVSADSHPISGEVHFTVTVGFPTVTSTPSSKPSASAPETSTSTPSGTAQASEGAGSGASESPATQPSKSAQAEDAGAAGGGLGVGLWISVGVAVFAIVGIAVALVRRRGSST